MLRSEDRILTTHAGSLPRPEKLKEMYIRQSQGEKIERAALQGLIEEATRAAVARQLDAGIDVGNNGEQARESFFSYVRERMTGFGGRSERPLPRDMTEYPSFFSRLPAMRGPRVDLSHAPKAIAEIAYADRGPLIRECADFARILAEQPRKFAEAFMTAPSPGIIAAAMANEHYSTQKDYITALADALRAEYEHIIRSGFVLQLDCPDLALERHTSFADRPLADFIAFVDTVISAINHAIEGLPSERIRLHVCWGNYSAPHDWDVPLAEILPSLYQARVGALVLEAANPRHEHEYRCFEHIPLPDSMCLVTGVIDTKTNYVEHPEVVADRIERTARAVGDPRRIIACTDCGFETSAGFGAVAEEVVWAKLRALRAGADLATRRLFG